VDDEDLMDEALALLDELEALLKDPTKDEELSANKANTSLALLVVDGLRAYLRGDHPQAGEDLQAAGEEILERVASRGRPV
jgi:hypothetical protein